MGKILFWLGVIAVIWIAFTFVQASARRTARAEQDAQRARESGAGRGAEGAGRGDGRGGSRGESRGEIMVRCAHCGVHLPQSEALSTGALHYCTPEHRAAGPKAP